MPLLANDPHLGASLPSVWHQIRLQCSTVSDGMPVQRLRLRLLGPARRRDRPQRAHRVGLHQPDHRRHRPLPREGRRRLVLARRRARAARDAHRDDQGRRRRGRRARDPLHGARPDHLGPHRRLHRHRRRTRTSAPWHGRRPADAPAGDYAVSLRWTRFSRGPRHPPSSRSTPRRTSTISAARPRCSTCPPEPHLRRRRRQHRVPDARASCRSVAPATARCRSPAGTPPTTWQGFIPFEELPVAYNPAEGYIVTANNAIVADDYPYCLTADWDYGWRAARIDELIQRAIAKGPVTADDMHAIQADNWFYIGMRLTAAYFEITTGDDERMPHSTCCAHGTRRTTPTRMPRRTRTCCGTPRAEPLRRRTRDPGAADRAGPAVPRRGALLDDPASPWWTNAELGVSAMTRCSSDSRDRRLRRLVELQGDNPSRWNWGSLHALPLISGTLRLVGHRADRDGSSIADLPGRGRLVGGRTRPAGTSA